VTLISYSPAQWRNKYVFRPVLKPRNESQSVLRPKGKLFQTRGAATDIVLKIPCYSRHRCVEFNVDIQSLKKINHTYIHMYIMQDLITGIQTQRVVPASYKHNFVQVR